MRTLRRNASAVASFAIAFALARLLCPNDAGAGELTAEQRRGRELFFKGAIAAEPIPMARIGDGSTITPATTAPCAGCHGDDGRGGSEGATEAPDITWRSLASLAGRNRRSGRRPGTYTEDAFIAAIARGVDPSGAGLGVLMPRYEFTPTQFAALIAYLQVIGSDQSPGVTDDRVRIGVLLPQARAVQPVGRAVLAVFDAIFQSINDTGGVYGRRIDMTIMDPDENAEATSYFALLDPSLSPSPRRAPHEDGTRPPFIGAMPPFDDDSADYVPSRFHVFGGLRENIDVLLADMTAQSPPTGPLALVRPEAERSDDKVSRAGAARDALRTIARLSGARGWPTPLDVAYGPGDADALALAARLQAQNVAVVMFLGDAPALYALLRAAESRAFRPYVLLPAPIIDGDVFALPPAIAARVRMAYAIAPAERSDDGGVGATPLAQGSGQRHAAAERAAASVAQVLVAGLKDAGRDLGVTRFVAAVEGLKNLETGVSHPLSFGPDRRIGAPGAYVVGLDVATKRFIRLSHWREAGEAARANAP